MALSKKDTKKKGAVKKPKAEAVHREDNQKANMKKTDAVAKEVKKSPPAKREPSKVSRIQGMQKFFRGVFAELKKVHWPNRREIITYTSVVLASVTFVAVLIWIFDSVLSQVLKLIL